MKGTYVSWLLSQDCSSRLHQWCRDLGLRERLAVGKHHCTIMHSTDDAVSPDLHGDAPLPRPWEQGYLAPVGLPQQSNVLGPRDGRGALVLMLDSPVMASRHRWWNHQYLLRHSHPEFVPHVSLSYDFLAQDPRCILRMLQTPVPFPMEFDREHVDWCD